MNVCILTHYIVITYNYIVQCCQFENLATLLANYLKCYSHAFTYRFERRKYYYHREKSRSEPNKYITIIIDGMDQNKTNVPNISQPSKSTSSLWKVRTHLTGALVHTKMEKGKLVFAFFDLLQWPHDSNLTISILLAVLVQVQTKLHILPEVLYLQLDNTCRENKNKYVFSFLALLVQLKIFKKV